MDGSSRPNAQHSCDELPPLHEAILTRCYDANEGVQVAAVQLLEQILERLAPAASCAPGPLPGNVDNCGGHDSTDVGASYSTKEDAQAVVWQSLLDRVRNQYTQWGEVGSDVQLQAVHLLQRFAAL